jgi:hypothetical protein
MSDMRIALYVYAKSTVTIDPSASVDFMRMNNDYTAKFEATISSSTTVDLYPGVYGFVYNGTHGVSGPSSVTLVTDVYDIQRKQPWPVPPPPPPPPFSSRSDWADHTTIFLVPLGSTFDLGADVSASGG